jgi:hypothetical protein
MGLSIMRVGLSWIGVDGQGTGLAEANPKKSNPTAANRNVEISASANAVLFITAPNNNTLNRD